LLNGCNSNQENAPIAERISHRGYDENKISGFITAIQDGYTILESDVRLRDEEPILLHNNEACSDCSSLAELLDLALAHNIKLIIEFKEFKAIRPSLELISQYNVDVVLTSFNKDHLTYINANSNHSLGFITHENYNLDELPIIDYLLINQLHIKKCTKQVTCIAWGVHTQKQFNQVKYKVGLAITDRF
jgi:glycerophosphoryl diester phosphodiesterase